LLHSERKIRLKRLSVFEKLSDAALQSVAEKCKWRNYSAGEHILDRHDSSTDVSFLLAGRARAISYSLDGKAVIFEDLNQDAMFGEIAAIDREERSVGIEALEACTVASLSADHFEKLMLGEPSVAVATLHHVVAMVRRLSERVFEFSTLAVQNRIHAELLRLAGGASQAHTQVTLSPAPSLSDIADRVSTHREAVSRELSRLTAIGLLRRERGNLLIADVGKLTELVRKVKGEI
jgi:CRP-like cAMP-binding protein